LAVWASLVDHCLLPLNSSICEAASESILPNGNRFNGLHEFLAMDIYDLAMYLPWSILAKNDLEKVEGTIKPWRRTYFAEPAV
jgi:hypothetical protein